MIPPNLKPEETFHVEYKGETIKITPYVDGNGMKYVVDFAEKQLTTIMRSSVNPSLIHSPATSVVSIVGISFLALWIGSISSLALWLVRHKY
jgi:hypothetical protein